MTKPITRRRAKLLFAAMRHILAARLARLPDVPIRG